MQVPSIFIFFIHVLFSLLLLSLLLFFSFFSIINFPIVSLAGFFCLSVFSPSKLPVSIKQIPSDKGESSKTKSAGNISSCATITISPNSKSPLSMSIHSSSL